ncbi:hypothetical protein HanXRQr2_Chr13g0590841 [Helianthus annuus]|uniref:Uncharacterized protein n=1 Tax=Helianthus annuus TaxID=4232 RepID=A0A9K3EI74_HELAN|nr:hypothetical protein HanXRQr2_Chr13g0590841 [Helianthus annuus]KAJ0849459.1 hypothetical protein HanPSC8_Chr13g0568971 [Helianthus annuus]
MFYFTDFLEKRAEFPLFLDHPDNTSCRYFNKIQSRFKQYIRFVEYPIISKL